MKGRYKDKELKLDKNLTAFINKLYKPEDISLPQGLNSIMRPYQLKGFEWIYSTIQSKLGICIADDMGLGKTLQVIAVILKLKEERKLTNQVLVICPTTLLGNWLREVEKFAPSLKAKIYHGDDRHYTESIDIVITTYNLVRIREEFFANRKWTLLVVDEAQNIKNPSTYQTQSIKALKSEFRIAMTGTPIENRLTELWSIFDFLNPDFLGTLKWFRAEYAMPIESYQIEHKVEEFKKITSPFMIRRLKSDKSIIADLPDKIVKDEFCYLSKEQIVIYQKILKEDLDIIEQLQGVSRRGKVFQMINALKQICNHPSHFTKKKAYHPNLSGKSERLVSLLQNILPTGEKTILFTQYTEMAEILLDILNKHLGIQPDFFHGGLMRKEREKVISDFQKDPAKQLILISLKAGGTGLNLVEATNVIHYDLWWNPAVEDQATDRAYRIGQTKNVQVHRLITLGTFEEKINSIIQGKRALTDLTLIKGEKWITELSNEELKELFSLTGGEIG
jgi:SNF2 family DNA or RNA helicase